jgi:hypothetical protein
MPRLIVKFLLICVAYIAGRILEYSKVISKVGLTGSFIPISAACCGGYLWGFWPEAELFLAGIPIGLFMLGVASDVLPPTSSIRRIVSSNSRYLPHDLPKAYIVGSFLINGILWLLVIIRVKADIAPWLSLLGIPFIWLGFELVDMYSRSSSEGTKDTDARSLFNMGLASSVFITSAALLLGHYFDLTKSAPLTLQLLLANMLFDATTIVIFVELLRWSNERTIRSTFRLFTFALTSIATGAIFAVISLYFGLLSSDHGMNPIEICYCLIGLSPNGTNWDFGPYFWVMHTTFLPCLMILVTVILAIFAKTIFKIVIWVLGEARAVENPMKYSAYFCFFLATILATLATGFVAK